MPDPFVENQTDTNNQVHETNALAYETSTSESDDNVSSIPAPSYEIGIDPPSDGESTIGDINQGSTSSLPAHGAQEEENKTAEDKETGEWKVPFDLDTVSKASDIKKYLIRLINNATQVGKVVTNSEDIVGDLESLELDTEAMGEMLAIIHEGYEGEEEVELTDIELLEEVATDFENSFNTNFTEVKSNAEGGLSKLKSFKKVNNQSDDLQAALQQAYYNTDNSLIKKITSVIDTIDEYNEKGGKLVGLASDNINYLKDSKIMDMLSDGKSRVSAMTSGAKDVLDVAVHLETLYNDIGNTGSNLGGPTKSLESIFEMTDKVINLVDLPGVNVIQGLWNHVYKPMIDVCISGMAQIEQKVGQNLRDITGIQIPFWKESDIGKDNTAPTRFRGKIDQRFEGGFAVFNFMWNAMCHEWHRLPNDEVVLYFENNYDRINAGAKDGKELPYEGIGPTWSIDDQALMFWAMENKHKLWAMFYGTNLPKPPKTKG